MIGSRWVSHARPERVVTITDYQDVESLDGAVGDTEPGVKYDVEGGIVRNLARLSWFLKNYSPVETDRPAIGSRWQHRRVPSRVATITGHEDWGPPVFDAEPGVTFTRVAANGSVHPYRSSLRVFLERYTLLDDVVARPTGHAPDLVIIDDPIGEPLDVVIIDDPWRQQDGVVNPPDPSTPFDDCSRTCYN